MLSITEGLEQYMALLRKNPQMPITGILPLMFQLNGKPYSVSDKFFIQEPLFKMRKIPRRAVTIAGRQVAKCCDPDSRVTLACGKTVPIGRLHVGDRVTSITTSDGAPTSRRVTQVFEREVKPGVRLQTAAGTVLRVSCDHRLLSDTGYRRAGALRTGDYLQRPSTAGLTPDLIVRADEQPEMEMVDIEVEGEHNFVLEGVVSHNSTSMAPSQIMRAVSNPFYHILTVTPLFEQIRRYSNNVVKPFLKGSVLKDVLITPGTDASVLQRSLANGSNLYYSYMSNSADRIRGLSVAECDVDEAQDIDHDLLPVMLACMSASPFKVERYSGTPKTTSNGLHRLWTDSSKGIWHIPCQTTGCKKLNQCSVSDGGVLENMLGAKTLVCAYCGKPVDSRLGYFVHQIPDRQMAFAGYHMPQPIFPMHYADPNAWLIIKDAQRNKPRYIFMNEFLGESYDVGAQMITPKEIQDAAVVPWIKPREHPASDYIMTATGCDYGGRGKLRTTDKTDFISNTVIAVAGMRSDGTVDVDFLHKIPYSNNPKEENQALAQISRDAHADWCAIDYAGAGSVHETLLTSAGWPQQRITPFTYSNMSAKKPIVFYQPPGVDGVRDTYILDKSRSLQLLVLCIKNGIVRLPSWMDAKHLLTEFQAIYSETTEGPHGSPKTLVKRVNGMTDDTVHAINFAVMALFHSTGNWPDMTEIFAGGDEGQWDQTDV